MIGLDAKEIQLKKQLGGWKPNQYLSNLCMTYYESAEYAARRLFPICPVTLPSGYYYTFSKADLARDNVRRKPDYGAVQPAVIGLSDQSYNCRVDQIIIGVDKIVALPYQRDGGAGDIYRQRIPMINEQIATHQELEFAQKFFKAGVWDNTWTGNTTDNAAQKKFKRFDDASSDPITFIENRALDIRRNGRRKPNKLALGVETFAALKNHPKITDKIKFTGTNSNPAVVNENVLAQIFGVEQVIVLDATANFGNVGEEDMQFISDPKGALLLYAPDAPSITEPSAGYLFNWQIDSSNLIAIDTFEGKDGSHTEFIEGLIAYDMKKVADCLAVYMADCVGK